MLKEGVKKNLVECILPFWMSLKDDQYGGFYGLVDPELKVHKDGEKGVILCSRILWTFSSAYMTLGDEKYLEYAEHAYRFLRDKCIDKERGGVYWSVNYDGTPCDTTKHSYNHSFAVYALATYFEATGDAEALKLAIDMFEIIEEKFTDDVGYTEAFDVNFRPSSNEKLSENGVEAAKTMNTALHIMEAYTVLYKVLRFGPSVSSESAMEVGSDGYPEEGLDTAEYMGRVQERLEAILECFADKIYQGNDRLEVFFDKDFKSIIDLQSYGHDIEASWLIDRTLEVLDDQYMGDSYIKLCKLTDKLAETILNIAVEKDGSVLNECERGVVNRKRIWWVQAEAIIGFVNYYQKHNGDDHAANKYMEAAENVWSFCENHFLDKRPGGEWYNELSDDLTPDLSMDTVNLWKCPYHTARMCMEVIERL